MTHNSSLSMVNHQHVSVMSVYRSSASLFAPGLSPARISGPGDTFIPLPRWCWMSVIHGCPSSVIRPSLLLLPVLGTVCPNMSCPHPLCLFSEVASRLCSFGVHSHDFYCNFCSAYAVTVVIFGHFNRSFFTLPTYMIVPHTWTTQVDTVSLLLQPRFGTAAISTQGQIY